MLNIGDVIEGEIEGIAFGGEGILRYRGFVVFVPFTAIGDRLLCQIIEKKRSFARGFLVELTRASASRTSPLCPYFGTCGGCQLQHLQQDAQLQYKLNAVRESLKRMGHLSFPPLSIVPAPVNWSYRRHITLHLRMEEGRLRAGYIGADHYSFVQVRTCPIFNSPEDSILREIQSLVGKIVNSGPPLNQEGRLMVLKNQRGQFILSFSFPPNWKIELKLFQEALQHSPLFAGMLIQTPEQEMQLGDIYCEETVEGLTFRFSPQTFIQNHAKQSLNIYRRICDLGGKTPGPILDLYCGFGMTSLLLAHAHQAHQGNQVTGIEYNPAAIQFARENAQANHVNAKQVNFIQGDVEKILPHWLKTNKPSLILMNPPRRGLTKAIIHRVLKARPDSMIYVSCMPPTLARDLKLLCQEGYEIKEGTVYDMFPQTAHVETLVYLEK